MPNNDMQIIRNGIARNIRNQRATCRRYAGTQWAREEQAALNGLRLAAASLKGIRIGNARSRSISRRIAAAADMNAERFL